MTFTLFGVLPWLIWFGWFVGWEAWGFRSGHDRWPTLSQLIKGWEDHKLGLAPEGHVVRYVVRRGVVNWTWQRWFVAAALPALLLVLWPHLILESF